MLDSKILAGSSRSRAILRPSGAGGLWAPGVLRGGGQDVEQPLLEALCTVFSLFCLVKSVSSAGGAALIRGCFSCCKGFLFKSL